MSTATVTTAATAAAAATKPLILLINIWKTNVQFLFRPIQLQNNILLPNRYCNTRRARAMCALNQHTSASAGEKRK